MALLIATYDYPQDATLRRLTAPPHDAQSLKEVLEDPAIGGFDVEILINEPHYVVGQAIGVLYRDRRPDDLTLLYFTGHGLKDDDGRLHLAMYDTRQDDLQFTALATERIDRAMTACVSRKKVLILDCCYSGAYRTERLEKAGTEVNVLDRFRGEGRVVLTASDATQYSFERGQVYGDAPQSVFTHHLVEGLRNGGADLDGDGSITHDELYTYVRDRVASEGRHQLPKKQDNVDGRILIARNGSWKLPGPLVAALTSPYVEVRIGAFEGLDHLYKVGTEKVQGCVIDTWRELAEDDSNSVITRAVERLRKEGLPLPSRYGEAGTPGVSAIPVDQQNEQRQARETSSSATPPLAGRTPAEGPGLRSGPVYQESTTGEPQPVNLRRKTARRKRVALWRAESPPAETAGTETKASGRLGDAVQPDTKPPPAAPKFTKPDTVRELDRRAQQDTDLPPVKDKPSSGYEPPTAAQVRVPVAGSPSIHTPAARRSGMLRLLDRALDRVLDFLFWIAPAVAVLAVLAVPAFIIWLPITDHRHNLAVNPVTGTSVKHLKDSCFWCESPGARSMRYEVSGTAPVSSTFLTKERDPRYLHAVVKLTGISETCDKDRTWVEFSFAARSAQGDVSPHRAKGALNDKDRSKTIEYFGVGKPAGIAFEATVRGPNAGSANCSVNVELKDTILHSLPTWLHWLAINYQA
ncbi:caspase family protein [Streptomyces sp. NBC_01381]|uniref:caspase, EACC1-associated type n=1 Tax=Streptomyces sp. NBC_01381 TaxID=2903845 RepID=UPI002255004E|nr:caspase family protein [Streptomyces sp. NBC_01381]MCX4667989.1 caspase family protein [Streptomyces sp. NBC_01381]